MAIQLKQEGDRRLRRPRARLERRRHLARQHLPRLRLRRPVAPLLVLLRAQPGLVALLLRPARDLGVPEAHRRARAASCRTSASTARSPTPSWDEDAQASGSCRRRRGEFRAQRRRRRHRRPDRAEAPRRPRPRRLRGRGLPLGPLEPRLRPRRASGSPSIGTGASAIQFVPQIQPKVARAAPLPAHAGLDRPARRPADQRRRKRLFRRFPALQRLNRGCIYWAREAARARRSSRTRG